MTTKSKKVIAPCYSEIVTASKTMFLWLWQSTAVSDNNTYRKSTKLSKLSQPPTPSKKTTTIKSPNYSRSSFCFKLPSTTVQKQIKALVLKLGPQIPGAQQVVAWGPTNNFFHRICCVIQGRAYIWCADPIFKSIEKKLTWWWAINTWIWYPYVNTHQKAFSGIITLIFLFFLETGIILWE